MMETIKNVVRWKPTWAKVLPRALAGVRPSEFSYRAYARQHRHAGIHESLSRKIVDALYFVRSEP